MDEKEIHDLAVAYATVHLQRLHREWESNPQNECFGDSEEVRQFVKYYRFALDNIPFEWDTID